MNSCQKLTAVISAGNIASGLLFRVIHITVLARLAANASAQSKMIILDNPTNEGDCLPH